MNFNNKKIYLIGLAAILAGLVFTVGASPVFAADCHKNKTQSYLSAFLNPLASLAEKVIKDFGYQMALATAPDPDTCGSDSVVCSDGAPAATISWPASGLNYDILTLGGPYTKLLLHMDGANGSTVFTDSAQGHNVTANGDAQISTGQSKFGGASGYFDGSGDYLSVPDSNDWYFTGDFTIDLWVRFSVVQATTFISQTNPSSIPYWRFHYEFNALTFGVMWPTGESPFFSYYYASGPWTPLANTWYHLAVVRDVNTFKLFINGTQVGSGTAVTMPNIAYPVWIGNMNYVTSYLNGYLDELHVSKGIARWTSNFTPPTEPYQALAGAGAYNSGTANSYTVPGLTNAALYVWSVEAYNSSGQSSASLGYTNPPFGSFTTPTCATPPTIVVQPQSQTIGSGQTANLSVSATTSCVPSSLSYQWYQGVSGDTSEPISGATASSYTTPDLTVTTNYWVKVTDNCEGSVNSSTATITVSEDFEDFSLNNSGSIYATLLKGQAGISSETTLTVVPLNEFSSDVALSVQSVSPSLPGDSTFSFTPSTLTSAQYSSGSKFKVNIGSGLTGSQTYTIVVQGVDGGLTRTSAVYLNVEMKKPGWIEF